MLRSLVVSGDTDASAVLVEDLEQLTAETVDDLYLAAFGPMPKEATLLEGLHHGKRLNKEHVGSRASYRARS